MSAVILGVYGGSPWRPRRAQARFLAGQEGLTANTSCRVPMQRTPVPADNYHHDSRLGVRFGFAHNPSLPRPIPGASLRKQPLRFRLASRQSSPSYSGSWRDYQGMARPPRPTGPRADGRPSLGSSPPARTPVRRISSWYLSFDLNAAEWANDWPPQGRSSGDLDGSNQANQVSSSQQARTLGLALETMESEEVTPRGPGARSAVSWPWAVVPRVAFSHGQKLEGRPGSLHQGPFGQQRDPFP